MIFAQQFAIRAIAMEKSGAYPIPIMTAKPKPKVKAFPKNKTANVVNQSLNNKETDQKTNPPTKVGIEGGDLHIVEDFPADITSEARSIIQHKIDYADNCLENYCKSRSNILHTLRTRVLDEMNSARKTLTMAHDLLIYKTLNETTSPSVVRSHADEQSCEYMRRHVRNLEVYGAASCSDIEMVIEEIVASFDMQIDPDKNKESDIPSQTPQRSSSSSTQFKDLEDESMS